MFNKPIRTEIIVINDGSTDGSDAICREYACKDSLISYFAKENTGLLIQEMVFVKQRVSMSSFVDSDDWVEHIYVEELHDKLMLRMLTLLLPIIIP
ncbi:MAG: glycosyltransferase [Streptococcus salivarius]